MIYTVTFNPSLDYIVSVDNFTCGIVQRMRLFFREEKESTFPWF